MNRTAKYTFIIALYLLTCASGVAIGKNSKRKVISKNIEKLDFSRSKNLNRHEDKEGELIYGFDYLDRELESPSYQGPIPPRQFTASTDCENIKKKLLLEIKSVDKDKNDKNIATKAIEHYYSFCYLRREEEKGSELYTGNMTYDLWKVMFVNKGGHHQDFRSLYQYAMSLFVERNKIANTRLKKTIEFALLGYFLTHGMRTLAQAIIKRYDKDILAQRSGFEIAVIAKAELAIYEEEWYEAYIWYDKLIQDVDKAQYVSAYRDYAIYMSAWCCYKLGYYDESKLYFNGVSDRSGEVSKAAQIDSQRLYSVKVRAATSKTEPFPYHDPLP